MYRDLESELSLWRVDSQRKPLMLRGARQVGKSYLARKLGREFASYVEVNFERSPDLAGIFRQDLHPERILRDLSIALEKKIIPGKTLLFLDEVQECPRAIQAMRYFYEELPQLHVLAAGSLIDFALEEVGVPVGRVRFLRLYPLSFLEFLQATGHESLRGAIEHGIELAQPLHEKLLKLLGEYMAVGGMPESVKAWKETQSLSVCSEIHNTLIDTYRQDFSKYARKQQIKNLESVFAAVPRLMGKKFVFSSVSPSIRSKNLRAALDLLVKAQVAHQICHSSSNGVPLGAEANPHRFKCIFLDVALAQAILGIKRGEWILNPVASLVNRGAITEAFVGQELLAYSSAKSRGELYYWVREKRGSNAEVDYVLSRGESISPVEVRSGSTGSLKSLQVFVDSKDACDRGYHLSSRPFQDSGKIKRYPLYAVSSMLRDLGE